MIHMNRRCALGAIALALASGNTVAAEYPVKPIRIITPNSAGSGADITTRRLGERLAEEMKQPVVVENRPGAGGVLGTQVLVDAPADGYTISLVSSNYVVFPHLYKNLRFHALKDITPIAGVAASPMVLVVRNDFPARTIDELKALALAKPGKLTFGSSGNGTILHLAGMYFQEAAKVQLQHIPYKGAGPVVPDLVAGVVDLAFMAPAAVQGLVNQGKLRIIAVSGAKRSPHLPDVPAIAETLPGFALDGWFAVIGPKNLPAGVLQKLQRSINQIIVSDSFKSQLAQEGAVPLSTTPQALRTFMEADYQKMGRLVRNSGAVID